MPRSGTVDGERLAIRPPWDGQAAAGHVSVCTSPLWGLPRLRTRPRMVLTSAWLPSMWLHGRRASDLGHHQGLCASFPGLPLLCAPPRGWAPSGGPGAVAAEWQLRDPQLSPAAAAPARPPLEVPEVLRGDWRSGPLSGSTDPSPSSTRPAF